MQYSSSLLQAVLRQDFVSFINKSFNTINPCTKFLPNWHLELLAEYLEAIRKGEIKRLIINIPPRSLKSVCISVAWPAWILGHDPSKRIIAASYSNILSVKHSLDTKFILASDWYKELFPATLLSKKHNQKSKFLTSENGFRFATSVGGSITGEGGDILIVDDPHNPVHIHSVKMRTKVIDWFEQTFLTRLNDRATGCVVVVMQRLHEHDLTGHLLENENWEHLKIPILTDQELMYQINSKKFFFHAGQMLHKTRDKMEELQRLEREIGPKNYQAQYLQEPLPQSFCLLSREDIVYYENLPQKIEYYIQSWDTAIKLSEAADYSVCAIFAVSEKKYYLISLIRKKMAYPELKLEVEQQARKFEPRNILIEDKASGQQLIQDLKYNGYKQIHAVKPRVDKITRFAGAVPLFQEGKIILPKHSAFNHILLNELLNFPNSAHDDIVDSISQFANFIKNTSNINEVRIRGLV